METNSNYDSDDEDLQHFEITTESAASSPPELSKFLIEIVSTFTARPRTAGEEFSGELFAWATYPLELSAVSERPIEARKRVLEMLDDVLVQPPQLGADVVAELVDDIFECCSEMARAEPPVGRVLRVDVKIDLLVDELPGGDEVVMAGGESEFGAYEDEMASLGFGDAATEVRFVAASEEAIAGLERVRVEVSEMECVVCLEDIPVGLEATRLPCLHHFHGDCIVKWLSTSKLCPLCRFELPS